MIKEQIKELREKKGWTQNDLAAESGLSVRTIQRIESGDSIPKGHTLNCLKDVFGNSLKTEDKIADQIKIMNMTCLSFLIIPFGNLIFPTYLWFKHRENDEVDQLGRKILNFQITWFLCLALISIFLILAQYYFRFNFIFWGLILMVLLNVIAIIRASIQISKNDKNIYKTAIKIL